MSRISIIQDELNNDPAAIGYTFLNDQQATDAMNEETRSINSAVPSTDIYQYLVIVNKLDSIESSINADAASLQRALEVVFEFDTTRTSVRNWLIGRIDALISAGLLTTSDKTNLIDLATTITSRSQILGLGTVKVGEISFARSL